VGREPRARPASQVIAFSLQQRPFDEAGYARLPEWLRTVIANSPDYKRAKEWVPPSPQLQEQMRGQLAAPAAEQAIVEQVARGVEPVAAKHSGGGLALDDLEDEIPFVTCDPAREPSLKNRIVL
jgi:hypothetical protein